LSRESEIASDNLSGNVVALCVLTESAGRQAAKVIEEALPGVRVELSADQGSLFKLRALAIDADLVVLTTASAKHAATHCAQRHPPARLFARLRFRTGPQAALCVLEDDVVLWSH